MRLIRVIHILYEYAESCTVVVQRHKERAGVLDPGSELRLKSIDLYRELQYS